MELKELVDRYQTAMNTIYREVSKILKEKIHSDITTDQFSTLQYIRNHDRCTSTEIAHKFGIGKSAVTAQTNKLFDKGLIERERDEADRRNVYLRITNAGLELVEYTETRLLSELSTYLVHFTEEEIRTFIRLLEELAHTMETGQKGDRV